MTRWRIKGCPRCGGDVFIDKDLNGWYEQCLQCSYRSELKSLTGLKKQPIQRDKEPAATGKL